MMDMMGAMMGAGGQGSKYKPKTEESIPDKYEAMLAMDDIAPAHRATLEKMALRRKQRETKQEEDRAAALEASLTPAHRAAMASDAAATEAARTVARWERRARERRRRRRTLPSGRQLLALLGAAVGVSGVIELSKLSVRGRAASDDSGAHGD